MTQNDIMNAALTKLGFKIQTSFTNDADIQLWYGIVKDYVLNQHWWTFTKKIATLSLLGASTYPNYSYQFTVPIDVGRIFGVYPNTKYEMINSGTGRILLANYDSLSLIYASNTYTGDFTPSLGNAMASLLAKEICYVRKMQPELAKIYEVEGLQLLQEAVNYDSASITPLKLQTDRYIDVRG